MSITIGRLSLDDPELFTEALGDQLSTSGTSAGAPTPGPRIGLTVAATLSSFTGTASETTLMRQAARRQFRSIMNNRPYMMTAPYILWTDDTEQSGWYVPGTATSDPYDTAGIQFGLFHFQQVQLMVVGKRRTHRRALEIYVRDRRLSTTPLDYLRRLYNTTADFGTIGPPAAVIWLPTSATDALTNASGYTPATGAVVAGMGGSSATPITGLPDLAVVSYEQPENSRNLGDVVIRDRRGVITKPTSGPDVAWEEVYGADYPTSSGDVPVIENGITRVRLDTTNLLGFAVDAYNSGTGLWSEQGKFIVNRLNGVTTYYDDTLVSSCVKEYSQERAVIEAVLSCSTDPTAREIVYITLQRGWRGPKIDLYLAPVAAGTAAGGGILWNPAAADTDISVAKVDAAGVAAYKTAWTTGYLPTNFPGTPAELGASAMNGENWIHVLRPTGSGVTQGVSFGVVQQAVNPQVSNSSLAYGVATNCALLQIPIGGAGIFVTQMGFTPTNADQCLNAYQMTLGSGTSTAFDSATYSGTHATATRTSSAAFVSAASWPNGAVGTFLVMVRAFASSGPASLQATTGSTTGPVVTTSSTSFVWLNLGTVIANGTLTINGWMSSGTGSLQIDRVEAVWLSDTTAGSQSGVRDLGNSVLYDTRQTPNVVARQ